MTVPYVSCTPCRDKGWPSGVTHRGMGGPLERRSRSRHHASETSTRARSLERASSSSGSKAFAASAAQSRAQASAASMAAALAASARAVARRPSMRSSKLIRHRSYLARSCGRAKLPRDRRPLPAAPWRSNALAKGRAGRLIVKALRALPVEYLRLMLEGARARPAPGVARAPSPRCPSTSARQDHFGEALHAAEDRTTRAQAEKQRPRATQARVCHLRKESRRCSAPAMPPGAKQKRRGPADRLSSAFPSGVEGLLSGLPVQRVEKKPDQISIRFESSAVVHRPALLQIAASGTHVAYRCRDSKRARVEPTSLSLRAGSD
jgi:hypothetical protein